MYIYIKIEGWGFEVIVESNTLMVNVENALQQPTSAPRFAFTFFLVQFRVLGAITEESKRIGEWVNPQNALTDNWYIYIYTLVLNFLTICSKHFLDFSCEVGGRPAMRSRLVAARNARGQEHYFGFALNRQRWNWLIQGSLVLALLKMCYSRFLRTLMQLVWKCPCFKNM